MLSDWGASLAGTSPGPLPASFSHRIQSFASGIPVFD